ncbi:hypothetical protein EV359DRAFT_82243 [Lentinula novae-zelandiae]|nr:hypothetical protein EV359DRAFT_82243 [Lentinula novae-zelandiae]
MNVAVKTEAPSPSSKALKVPKITDVVSGNDEVTRIPKIRGRKPKNRTTDASEVPKRTDVVSGNDSVKPIPKKQQRKPNNSITDKPRRQGKTSGDCTASQSAMIQKKGVRVSLDLGETADQYSQSAKSKLPTSGCPVWKAHPVSPPPMGFANSIAPNMNPRLRQWCGLVGTSPVPVILIEGNEGMSISDSKLSNKDRTVVDLYVERDFVCVVSDLSVSSNSSWSLPMTGIHSSSITLPQSAENLEELCKGEVKILPPKENEEPSEDIQPDCTHVTRLLNSCIEPDAEKTVSASHDVSRSQSIFVNYEEPPVTMISGWSHDKDSA